MYYENVVRAYRDSWISFLMEDATDRNRTFLFVYFIKYSQHNSFSLAKDFSEFYGKSSKDNFADIAVAGDTEYRDILVTITSEKI